MANFRIEGLDRVIAKIKSLLPASKRGLMKGAEHVKDKLATYPAQRRHTMTFVSDRQRRYFFANLREGRINVPYNRSRTLGEAWKTRSFDDGLSVSVENNTPYGPFVQDTSKQTAMHKTSGWATIQAVAKSEGKVVAKFIGDEIRNEIGK